ncbi:MAG: alpha/beta hydrolase [Cytophagales bacterium]|nr:alpha/beta hydrolase [Cytophagales bacterium]
MIRYSYLIILFLVFIGCTDPETDQYNRFYFRHNNADLAVEVNGNLAGNNFILLLHGGPGGGSYVYNYGAAADMLEEDYAVVYLDQRGHGASRGNYDQSDVTLQTNSDDIYALTLFLKQKYGADINVFLLGHSWGGLTGTHALLNTNLQNEVAGWIEVAGAHDIPLLNVELTKMFIEIGNQEIAADRNVSEWQERVDYAQSLDITNITFEQSGRLNELAHSSEALLDQLAEADEDLNFSHGLFSIPVLTVGTWFANLLSGEIYNAESEVTSLTDRLGEINVPTLLLWGRYDFVVPPALGVSADSRIPNSELIIFDQSAHSPMSNEPQEYVAAIKDFIERN